MQTTTQQQAVTYPEHSASSPQVKPEHPLVAVWLKDPQTGRCYCRWVRDR